MFAIVVVVVVADIMLEQAVEITRVYNIMQYQSPEESLCSAASVCYERI